MINKKVEQMFATKLPQACTQQLSASPTSRCLRSLQPASSSSSSSPPALAGLSRRRKNAAIRRKSDLCSTAYLTPTPGSCPIFLFSSFFYTLLPDDYELDSYYIRELPEKCLDRCVYTVDGTSTPTYCFQQGLTR